MNFEIQTSSYFDAEAKRLAKKHRSFIDDLVAFQTSILNNPYQGTELAPGIRKISLYPLFPDGTCWFLVFDFDNHDEEAKPSKDWQQEVDAMRQICKSTGIDALVERSRSGLGAHLWIFFSEAVSASKARKFGEALLAKGAESVNLKSFRYYDRMMPMQDILPDGKLGNLIELPLQGKALRQGNSVFVDENWIPYENQWGALLNIRKLSNDDIRNHINLWCPDNDTMGLFSEIEEESEDSCNWYILSQKDTTTGIIDVAMITSLGKDDDISPIVKNYGMVIIDECHHAAAVTHANVLRSATAKYIYGMTATAKRGDKQDKKLIMLLGPIRHRYTAKERALKQGIGHYVYPRFTRLLDIDSSKDKHISDYYRMIIQSESRNLLIIKDTIECVHKGRTPIIMTKYREHAEVLYHQLQGAAQYVFLLQGGNSMKARAQLREKMLAVSKTESMVVVAIGQYIGEGFNSTTCPQREYK
ncbi:MAG: DEAD/DEAH box helicase family protein [Bacteroidaceae bacterium]|nr:DEAD/DEAH box helicase family protein [Bacteroidaceae bacterium]MBO7589388.1 DEAD/DEAH box helicase family protein [Bacteroidaceae bacterium]